MAFLVGEKSFNEDRVRKALKRVADHRSKSGQSRLESFFQVMHRHSGAGGDREWWARKEYRQEVGGQPQGSRGRAAWNIISPR